MKSFSQNKIFKLTFVVCFSLFMLAGGFVALYFGGIFSTPSKIDVSAHTSSMVSVNVYTQTGTTAYSSGSSGWTRSVSGGSVTVDYYYIDTEHNPPTDTGVKTLTVVDDSYNPPKVWNGHSFSLAWDTVNTGSTHYNGFYVRANANSGYAIATMDGDDVFATTNSVSSSSTNYSITITFCRAINVTLSKNGGTGGSSSVQGCLGYKPTYEVATPPTKTGYRFDGYCVNANAANPVYYIDSSGYWTRTFDITSATTLYAHWTPITDYFTVNLDKQNGTGGSSSVNATAGGTPKSITPPTRTGYTFQGYHSGRDGIGIKYYNADGTAGSGVHWPEINLPTTLYAYWTANKYQIKFERGTNSGTEYATATYDAPLPDIVLPVRSGYTFNGYWTKENGTGVQYYSATGAKMISAYKNTDVMFHLYAAWEWNVVESPWKGKGTESQPYQIANLNDLVILSNNANSGVDYDGVYFAQIADIDMGSYADYQPIGTGTYPFNGIYDGQNYKIKNIYLNGGSNLGLFGYGEHPTIKNVNLIGGSITGDGPIGSIIGFAAGTGSSSPSIINCFSSVDVSGSITTGGIAGYVVSGVIENCCNQGNVTAIGNQTSPFGGIVGYMSEGQITRCANRGNVSGGFAGGIAGYLTGGSPPRMAVISCTQSSNVTSNVSGGMAGALVGNAACAYMNNCACYGSASGQNENVGIVGQSTRVSMNDCSFIGTMNTTSSSKYFYGSGTKPSLSYCYIYTSTIKQYIQGSNYASGYGLVPTMNDGLPMQKILFSIANAVTVTHAKIIEVFNQKGLVAIDTASL